MTDLQNTQDILHILQCGDMDFWCEREMIILPSGYVGVSQSVTLRDVEKRSALA